MGCFLTRSLFYSLFHAVFRTCFVFSLATETALADTGKLIWDALPSPSTRLIMDRLQPGGLKVFFWNIEHGVLNQRVAENYRRESALGGKNIKQKLDFLPLNINLEAIASDPVWSPDVIVLAEYAPQDWDSGSRVESLVQPAISRLRSRYPFTLRSLTRWFLTRSPPRGRQG